MNTAARLESAAPLDSVLVDGWTYRATERAIRYEPVEAVVAKGKAEPVEAWVAVEARSIVPERARVGGLPLVGRDARAQLGGGGAGAFAAEPSTQLVSVIGEPGIGKSRLVVELLAMWRSYQTWSRGGGAGHWPMGRASRCGRWVRWSRARPGSSSLTLPQVAGAKLAEAVAAVVLDEHDRGWVERHLRPLVGLEARERRGGGWPGGGVRGVAAVLRSTCRERPDGTGVRRHSLGR